MPKNVFILVNGILTNPGSSKEWTDRAVHWINNNGGDDTRSYAFEYYSPALLRFMFQRGHADNLAETIGEYPKTTNIHLVGHSNGCDLIARALRLSSAEVASVHLIAGAVESNFVENGMGELVRRGRIGRLNCMCSKGDSVLKVAAKLSQIASLGILGYGRLGYEGPNVGMFGAEVQTAVGVHWRNEFGHSDWFRPENFDATMRHIFAEVNRPQLVS